MHSATSSPKYQQNMRTLHLFATSNLTYMDVPENSGTPKSSILIGFSIINHPFWGTTISTHMYSPENEPENAFSSGTWEALKAERGQLSQPNQPTQPIPVPPPKRPQMAARDLNCRYGNAILDL